MERAREKMAAEGAIKADPEASREAGRVAQMEAYRSLVESCDRWRIAQVLR